jgi:hypothetical protein
MPAGSKEPRTETPAARGSRSGQGRNSIILPDLAESKGDMGQAGTRKRRDPCRTRLGLRPGLRLGSSESQAGQRDRLHGSHRQAGDLTRVARECALSALSIIVE